MIVWLTGQSGAGKTTLVKYFIKKIKHLDSSNWLYLDGDEMRDSISLNAGFSKSDREEHNLRIARLANILSQQGYNIIVSVIAPYESTRQKINKIIDCQWIYLKRILPFRENYPYEEPKCFTLNIDDLTIKEEFAKLYYYLFL